MLRLIALLALLAAPAQAQRMEATADCAPGAADLSYDCRIAVTSGGAPVAGAAFVVRPDMPSMPMAHAIPPVVAEPMAEPGAYAVPLTLDMHGRWLLRLEFTEPRRDMLVIDAEFEPGPKAQGGHSGH